MIHNYNKLLLFGEASERILFRKVEDSDFNEWMKFCAETNALKYIFSKEDQLLSPTQKCEKWFEKVNHRYQNNLGGMNALIEKETGQLIGQCGLLIQNIDGIEELEIGYSLIKEYRGKGFASEAAQKCKEFAIENQLSDSLISVIMPGNYPSIAVALKNGMRFDKVSEMNNEKINVYRYLI